jgi:hypothetical protein
MLRTTALITTAALACSTAATAGVTAFATESAFTAAANAVGLDLYSQSFTTYSGTYSNVSGALNGVQWAAQSSTTLNATSGVLSTSDNGDSITISFSGTSTTAIGGDFFSLNSSGSRISAVAVITLADGQTFVNQIGGGQFRGYVSSGAAIRSISLTPYTNFASRPSVERLIVGTAVIPAPGAIVLLGLAGLAGGRRRRA